MGKQKNRSSSIGLIFVFAVFAVFAAFITTSPALFSQPGPNDSPGPGNSVQIRGVVINGTTGAPASPEKIELIRPGQTMTVLHTMENPGSRFIFPPVERVSVPFLVRATFEGETYVAVVPPTPERQNALQKVEIFDSGAKASDLNIMPGMEMLNEEEMLRINLVYSVENVSRPPRTYSGGQFEVAVPDGVRIAGCQLAHESSRMPAPVPCSAQNGKVVLPKGFRPGSSQLTVQLEQSERNYRDPETAYPFKVLVWKPEEARPAIQGQKSVEELNIRGLGPALKVDYRQQPVNYELPEDRFYYANPLQSDYNPVFRKPWETLAAVLGVLAFIFVLLSIVSSFRIQVRRAD
ncbi:MAG: hypothetical protein KDK23_08140 [Leptospiraceae bacterium]|nr:hypothetical protein [Leptospiraceae bacterium]